MTELKGKVVKGKETVADLSIKLNATEKRAEGVAYEKDHLQAFM